MSAETPKVLLPPPILYAVAIGLGLWLEHPLPWPLPGGALRFWVGAVMIGLAVALFGLCLRELRRHQTTINPHRAASNLVETGPFRFSRNPIYLSLTVLQMGLGLLAGSTWVLLMLLWVLPVMQRRVIAREEEHLRWRFGSEYADYSARVRRWL
ncbi:methyltransferase family protein [Immundisolibacter sp.]